jgi:predicted RND superfamily exporter protein
MVNLLSIGGIALILLFTFRSLSLPIILLLTIETSIFINLSIPYFTDTPMHYIAYLVISSVQLGATVDYAILFTDRYIENRGFLGRKKAARRTIADCASSLFTSGGILIASGLVLSLTSSNLLIAQLGTLVARGSFLSMTLVLVFLPGLLTRFDPLVVKTTWKLKEKIIQEEESEKNGTQE